MSLQYEDAKSGSSGTKKPMLIVGREVSQGEVSRCVDLVQQDLILFKRNKKACS